MNYVYYIYNNVKYLYNSMNPASLSGAIDVIVVEQPDGTLLSTPFHVRFGKYGVFTYENKYVDVEINNEEIDLKMKLGENGVAFFAERVAEDEQLLAHLETSPLPEDDGDQQHLLEFPDGVAGGGDQQQHLEFSGAAAAEAGTSGSTLVDGEAKLEVGKLGENGVAFFAARVAEDEQLLAHLETSPLPDDDQHLDLEFPAAAGAAVEVEGSGGAAEAGGSTLVDGEAKHDTEWKWGEIPKSTTKPKDTTARSTDGGGGGGGGSRAAKKSRGWNWFRRPPEGEEQQHQQQQPAAGPDAEGGQQQPTTAAAEKEKKQGQRQEGLYLQDLGSSGDPSKLERYFGKRSGAMSISSNASSTTTAATAADSGTGPSLGTSPNSPPSGLLLSLLLNNGGDLGATTTCMSTAAAAADSHSQQQQATLVCREEHNRSGNDGTGAHHTMDNLSTPTANNNVASSSTDNHNNSNALASTSSSPPPPTSSIDDGIGTNGNNKQMPQQQPIAATDEQQQQRDRFGSGRSQNSCATDLNLSDEESTSVTLGVGTSGGGSGSDGGGRAAFEKKTKYKRSLRLSSDQLKLLNLDYGSNDARFSITTKLQGTAWCSCHIYLLRWSDKLVISDIDGTITKSDVLGHVIPAIGGTWAHSGVAELYTRIKNNGYQMVYLSSRAIGQSHYTKTYLQSIAQGTQTLPDGPVLLSPTSVLMAFRKEVIERRPEEFKIACLADLKSLFPVARPFFAGFGNRETDVKSYRAVDIPLERILIIDPSGMLRRADKIGYVSDYATMALDTVDYIFPPMPLTGGSDPAVQIENSEFNTWRCHPQQFDHLVDEELEAYEERRKRRAAAEAATTSEAAAAKKAAAANGAKK